MAFKTTKQAEIRVPQEGFTLDDLKKHMRENRIPADALLKPAIVSNVDPSVAYDSQFTPDKPVETESEVAFLTEWEG